MKCRAVVDRFVSAKIKNNSLTITEKYHFDDEPSAIFFLNGLKKLDRRVISYKIERE
jgi:hypothetical protein